MTLVAIRTENQLTTLPMSFGNLTKYNLVIRNIREFGIASLEHAGLMEFFGWIIHITVGPFRTSFFGTRPKPENDLAG